jgi:hypothetical protein
MSRASDYNATIFSSEDLKDEEPSDIATHGQLTTRVSGIEIDFPHLPTKSYFVRNDFALDSGSSIHPYFGVPVNPR